VTGQSLAMGTFHLLSLIFLPIIACSECQEATKDQFLNKIPTANSQEAIGDQALNQILTASYRKESIPQKTLEEPIPLSLNFVLTRIVDFDDDDLVVSMNGWIGQTWTDFRLTWDPAFANNVKSVRVSTDKIWIPDVVIYNEVRSGHLPDIKAVVMNNGTCLYIPPTSFSLPCVPVERGKFNCSAEVGSWTYDGDTIDLANNSFENLYMSENPKYAVSNTNVIKRVTYYPCCPEPYQSVGFSFILNVKK